MLSQGKGNEDVMFYRYMSIAALVILIFSCDLLSQISTSSIVVYIAIIV